MPQQTFDSYEEFWPYYVAMHSRAATRWVHLTGTLTGLAITTYGLARGRKRYAAALPLIGYGTAWPVRGEYRIKRTCVRARKSPAALGVSDGAGPSSASARRTGQNVTARVPAPRPDVDGHSCRPRGDPQRQG
ncbi:DUF962 domain-containing protein [Streptomyces sp. NBC_01285]|uniref:DUF962 domain-containing protein n=1 Tax=Streptomyces sp. NBC_01285 TaxID=2903813 RepID=UPI00224DF49B|nr:DUF962 domain-containing protein [Streptomyces sp. NBC_01285]MCX4774034.1 DUF962 domain-containing protein [Streptomyces sp. NBC_01285]